MTGMTTLGAATLIQGPGLQARVGGSSKTGFARHTHATWSPKTCHKDDIVGLTGPSFCVPLINFVCFPVCVLRSSKELSFTSFFLAFLFRRFTNPPWQEIDEALPRVAQHMLGYILEPKSHPTWYCFLSLASRNLLLKSKLRREPILFLEYWTNFISISILNAPKGKCLPA